MMKFKVGDLVVLSAAGRRVGHNSYARGGWGIIKEINNKNPHIKNSDDFPIKTQWYSGSGWVEGNTRSIRYKPYELKFFKKSS